MTRKRNQRRRKMKPVRMQTRSFVNKAFMHVVENVYFLQSMELLRNDPLNAVTDTKVIHVFFIVDAAIAHVYT